MLLSVGFIIFLVLGTSTVVHIHNLRHDYLEALTWRSEALAQSLINEITDMENLGLDNIQDMFPPLALQCIKLHEFSKDQNVSHFAMIDSSGMIGPHNDSTFWKTPVASDFLLNYIQQRKPMTVLDNKIYHTLVPVFSQKGLYFGTIDIGIPKRVVDEKIQRLFFQSVVLFVMFLLLAFFLISFLMHILLTKPVRHLVELGEELAAGRFVHIPQTFAKGDEVTILTSAFRRISLYLRNVAEVADAISTGDLRGQVTPRSERDALGVAFQRMSAYLNRLATTATTIARGNLQHDVQPESEHDVLGNAFHAMAVQLRENFKKIQQEVAERTHTQEALQRLNEELEQRVERRTAELARGKYILETFMNTVPDKIYFKDLEGRITRANKAHAAGYGFRDPAEELGKTDFDLLPADLARITFEQEQEIMRTGEPLLDRELPIPQPDGSVRWSLVTKMPLRDENGEIIGTFGLSRDMTSQKQAQGSLEQAYSEILSLNRQLQDDTLRFYLKALLLGAPSVTSATTIDSTMKETWSAPGFCVVLMKLLPVSVKNRNPGIPFKTSSSSSIQEIMTHLRQWYETYTNNGGLPGILSHITDTETACILNSDNYTQVYDLCTFLATQSEPLLRDYPYTLVFGIGHIVTAPENIHVSYDAAQQAIFARSNGQEMQILSAEEIERHKRDILLLSFPVEKEQQLITAVIAGQQTHVHELLQDIINQNTLEQSSYQKLLSLHNHFLQTAGKILAQAPIRETGSGDSPLLQAFRAAKPETIQELRDRLSELFRQLLTLYSRERKQQNDLLTNKLFRYLERHSANPNLSLDSLAEVFSLNPSYLSRYFKEQSGMNYVEYLAMLRIRHAKNLLVAHPAKKIQEIGIKVGFSGKETFIRTFKRFEGVTPGTYRKRALSHAEV